MTDSGMKRPPTRATPRVTAAGGGSGRVLLAIVIILMSGVAERVLVTTRYQGIPNVLTPSSITYTPAQGPSNPLLLKSRPDRIYQRYLDDYLRLAGTYPCKEIIGTFYDEYQDPVLNGKPCPVTRPVVKLAITRVTIQDHGLFKQPSAVIHVEVTYATGVRWGYDQRMSPDESQNELGIFWMQLDCWSGFDTLQMFGRLVPDVPAGAWYYVARHGNYLCRH